MRGGCGSGDNPTCFQFIGSLKIQILNGLTTQKLDGNCEADEHELLTNLQQFLSVGPTSQSTEELGVTPLAPSSQPTSSATATLPATAADIFNDAAECVAGGNTEILSVAYVSGYISGRILSKIECDMCHDLLTAEPDQPHNMFITFKEWSEKQQKLSYPSDSLVTYVCAAVTALENFLPAFGGKTGVTKDTIQQIIQTVPSAWFTCDQHKEFYFTGYSNRCMSNRNTMVLQTAEG